MLTMDLAKQYQRKTDKQHVLDNPDTYIGSVEKVDAEMWVFEDGKIVLKTIEYIPGLFKLMDEGIVNCRDHVLRMNQSVAENKKLVTHIDVHIADGKITFMNDGNGIDVAEHPEEKIWIPELVFGHLRTSTNYDVNEKKIVGGKNGFGFKLVLIWSTWGRIETVDHVRGLKYVQEFHDNLTKIDPPKITKCTSKPYTKVSFMPDYKRLNVTGLSNDMISLMQKRVYDIAAVTDHAKKVKVTYNGQTLSLKSFAPYVDMYIGPKEESKRVYENSDRWEYVVALAPSHEFQQISFVNGVCTFKGGKHVDYIMGQILRKLGAYIEKKKKVVVNQNSIKEQIILFLRCDIENPSFDSQTKDFLTTPSSKFGSSCVVSDAFIEKIAKMGVMEMACQLTETKEAGKTKKKMDGSKTKTVRGIANFVDANYAGTEKSKECTLILAEGLSAMSGIVSGLKSEDRNVIGIYPLKGKVLNVRGTTKDIRENKELADLIKILGLEIGREYGAAEVHKCLRYSKVMIMADQDLDGSHIKGLCINLFHAMWPSLVRLEGFLSFMNTPILRATKGNQLVRFYNEGEYLAWKQTNEKGWTLKYFKGLGTSTSTEFKEYFAHPKKVHFRHSGLKSDDAVDMVFNKKRAEDRKCWLEKYDKKAYLDTKHPVVDYEAFFNNEMVHFSVYDCERSIPNMVDGLKTSLRKILYSAFKRNLTKEIKVAQFSGFVSENSAYHHGEASLNGAIVHMAQNFVGSNNINLLVPNGQFGTRLKGGEDSASERYIFTCLNPITRYIFPEADDKVLTYLEDDGQKVEPEFYVPIIPFALVNGLAGIGTGFSCNIPSYSPLELIHCIRQKISNASSDSLFQPYYEGFTGSVQTLETGKFLIKGKYQIIREDTILITELPIGTWTMNYLSFLEDCIEKKTIKDFVNMSTEVIIHITVHFVKGKLAELNIENVEKLLHLTSTASTSNMNLFNADIQLHKYKTVHELIDAFYVVRLAFYVKRKAAEIEVMKRTLSELSNRAKFIQQVVSGDIDLRKMTNDDATDSLLQKYGYTTINESYQYLTKMPMHSMNKERAQKISDDKIQMEKDLDTLQNTLPTDMWLRELLVLEKEYAKYKADREKLKKS